MAFTGRTGPYVQYARARINSVLKKSEAGKATRRQDIRVSHPADRDLALAVFSLPAAVSSAASELQAKPICDAVYNIATAVARLYAETEILRAPEDEREGRLALLEWAGNAIDAALYLLGIEVPERM